MINVKQLGKEIYNMEKSIIEQMEEFIQTVTPESFLNDCENFGIKLEESKYELYDLPQLRCAFIF